MPSPAIDKLIAAILKNDPSMIVVRYAKLDLTDKDVIEICAAIKQNSFIKSLELSLTDKINHNITAVSCEAIAELTKLEVLKIGPNPTMTSDAVIAKFANHPTLHSLHFCCCQLSLAAVKSLAASTTLRLLSFNNHNYKLPQGSIALIARNAFLHSLSLICEIPDEIDIAELIANKTLKKLSLLGKYSSNILRSIAVNNTTLEILQISAWHDLNELKLILENAKIRIHVRNFDYTALSKETHLLLQQHADQIEAKKQRTQQLLSLCEPNTSMLYLNCLPKDLLFFTFKCMQTNAEDSIGFVKGQPQRNQAEIKLFKNAMGYFSENTEFCLAQIESLDFSRLAGSDLTEDATRIQTVPLFDILQRAAHISDNYKDQYIKAEIFRLLDHPLASQKALKYYSHQVDFLCHTDAALFYESLTALKHIPIDNLELNKKRLIYYILKLYVDKRKPTNKQMYFFHLAGFYVLNNLIEKIKKANYLAHMVELVLYWCEANEKAAEFKGEILRQLPSVVLSDVTTSLRR